MSRGDGFLGRWSRRKREARSANPQPEAAPAVAGAPPARNVSPAPAEPPARAPLPPVESLTPESDFAPFMQRDVDPTLKGRALKTLFGDPALYPMDGLDVYIDDYSKPDPLPEGWLGKLNQLAMLDGGEEARRDDAAAVSSSDPPAISEAAASGEPEAPGPPQDADSPARKDRDTI